MKSSRVVLAWSLAAAAAACGGEPGELPISSEPVNVEVSTAAASYSMITLPGTIVATEEAELATRISGTIRQVLVDIGARVSAGAPLVTLDSKEIDARIRSAEAAALLARQWHQRIAALAADGAATAQELDDANARLQMAEAALRDVRAQRDYVVLRAPFDGVITARMADPGDLAVPGVPILTMIGTTSTKIEADLPAEMAGRLAVGHPVMVHRPETARRYPATVTRVVPALKRASRRFRVEARFQPDSTGLPGIPPGAFVRIELGQPTTMTRWIPADVVVTRGQLEGVFVVEGDELRLRWVRLGQRLGETVELLAGPGTDALLVRAPAAQLVDGQPIAGLRQLDWLPPFVAQQTAGVEGIR
ncbi:MAG: efflux RND transporter periplasmic adaptor subunit [Gemmatimonadota bacterium]|nr:MAG: efflux RND transporter periplasmic adaptor subunit [Gemmatimonadota bacterium]